MHPPSPSTPRCSQYSIPHLNAFAAHRYNVRIRERQEQHSSLERVVQQGTHLVQTTQFRFGLDQLRDHARVVHAVQLLGVELRHQKVHRVHHLRVEAARVQARQELGCHRRVVEKVVGREVRVVVERLLQVAHGCQEADVQA